MKESKTFWVSIIGIILVCAIAIWFILSDNPMASTVLGLAFVLIMTILLLSTINEKPKRGSNLTVLAQI
jgi:hypothetical protein